MPYFVYKIYPGKRLVPVQSCGDFRAAKELARSLRASMTAEDAYTAKVVFAKDEEDAQHLLTEERERIMREDDW